MRARILEWFPQADDVVVPGAGHTLALTHAPAVVSAFTRRHAL